MRFETTHKAVSYLAVLLAFGTLALSNELPPALIAFALGAGVLSWWWEEPRVQTARYELAFNLVALFALLASPLRYRQNESLAHTFAEFLVVLALNRLFNRRTAKDYLYLYVVSFGLLLGATVLNTELVFAPCFLLYVVAITWSLTLASLRRQVEESALVRHDAAGAPVPVEIRRILQSRRIVGRSFLLGTAGLSLAMLLCSSIVFFLFPRIGMGLLGIKQNRGRQMAGFSDQVQLGGHGAIKDNPEVVMRVEMDQPPGDRLHFRGLSFDTYKGGKWDRSLEGRRKLRNTERTSERLFVQASSPPEHRMLKQTVYLSPLGTQAIFAASTPVVVYWNQLRGGRGLRLVEGNVDGDLLRSDEGTQAARYVVYSDPYGHRLMPGDLDQNQLGRLEPRARGRFQARRDEDLERALQIPEDIAPSLERIVAGLVKEGMTDEQKVAAVNQYLKGFTYTVEIPPTPDGRDPVVHFLETTRRGHCEYFASAGTLLLRAAGVPALEVNGFYGGAWNSSGGFLALRQGDAHAWTEAYVEGKGWRTLDFTPPRGREPLEMGGPLAAMRQIVDQLEMAWFKWVVDYDMRRQLDLAMGLRDRFSWRSSGGGQKRGAADKKTPVGMRWLLAPAVLAALAFAALRLRRAGTFRRAAVKRRRGAVDRLYRQMLRRLAARGVARAPAQTPRELARALQASHPDAAPVVERVVDLYYDSRFGDLPPPPRAIAELRAELARL